MTNKRLIPQIFKHFMQLKVKSLTQNKQKSGLEKRKWIEKLNRHFSKEKMQMAKGHMKRCLISLIIVETQIKATMKYHLTLVRISSVQSLSHIQLFVIP